MTYRILEEIIVKCLLTLKIQCSKNPLNYIARLMGKKKNQGTRSPEMIMGFSSFHLTPSFFEGSSSPRSLDEGVSSCVRKQPTSLNNNLNGGFLMKSKLVTKINSLETEVNKNVENNIVQFQSQIKKMQMKGLYKSNEKFVKNMNKKFRWRNKVQSTINEMKLQGGLA